MIVFLSSFSFSTLRMRDVHVGLLSLTKVRFGIENNCDSMYRLMIKGQDHADVGHDNTKHEDEKGAPNVGNHGTDSEGATNKCVSHTAHYQGHLDQPGEVLLLLSSLSSRSESE